MGDKQDVNSDTDPIRALETALSETGFELEEVRAQLKEMEEAKNYYQMIADFTYGWELWFTPEGSINYCSPSCLDITGYSANQVLEVPSLSELIVYSDDHQGFDHFLTGALNQMPGVLTHDFRIFTRSRQLRWCSMSVRGVYSRQGRYLGIRASIHDITRLRNALGQIASMATGKELEERNRQRLKNELEMKEREVVATLLQLSQKNELVNRTVRMLQKIVNQKSPVNRSDLEAVLKMVAETHGQSIDWQLIEMPLEKLHPGFMERLVQKYPRLTSKEKKLCACLKLGLTSREIGGLRNMSPQSVEIARVRLRKKLKVPVEKRLTGFLDQI